MSRGFDVDDFRDSDSSRDVGRGSSSGWDSRNRLSEIHREEERTDQRNQEQRERSDKDRPPLPREERVQAILAERVRTKYADRDKTYSLRDSEIHTLSEVGKFRVVTTEDLAQFAYNGDGSRMENDIENLARQGLVRESSIATIDSNPGPVVTLTKEGHKLLSRGKVVPSGQATYHDLKKPKEAIHDADLYRLYHKAADEIEADGGKVLRVMLDYEMKHELYSRHARASKESSLYPEDVQDEVARNYHLRVVDGKIPIPDLRIEYVNENDNEIQRRDLELATEHYHSRAFSEKARAGFQIYARPEDAAHFRRVRDDHHLITTIFRL
jgi:hypothetical protein